ncbi:MAG: homoserine kinase [Planctomycetota bacterium]
MTATTAVARAPATVANVAVGFDVLGFAFAALEDVVTVTRVEAREGTPAATLVGVEGGIELPRDPSRNTATAALLAMARDLADPPARGDDLAFAVTVRKGIPMSSGMGGSAASAVGAVVAANALLPQPLPRERLLRWAIEGEAVASGAWHPDNVAPCLFGGLCATLPGASSAVIPLPTLDDLFCVVARPHLQINTREARSTLRPVVPLAAHVAQSAHLAAFVAACYRGDATLLSHAMQDLIVGPQRAERIPGWAAVRRAAADAGAIGCAIAGSGPSLFAWALGGDRAQDVRVAMVAAFAAHEVETDAFVGPIAHAGAEVVA